MLAVGIQMLSGILQSYLLKASDGILIAQCQNHATQIKCDVTNMSLLHIIIFLGYKGTKKQSKCQINKAFSVLWVLT